MKKRVFDATDWTAVNRVLATERDVRGSGHADGRVVAPGRGRFHGPAGNAEVRGVSVRAGQAAGHVARRRDGTSGSPRPRDHLAGLREHHGVAGAVSSTGGGGALAAAVGVAFDDKLVAGGGEPVDGGLGQQRVGHEREPLLASRLEVTTVEARRWRSVMIS